MNYGDISHNYRDLIALLPLGAFLLFFSCAILSTFRRKRKFLALALSSVFALFSFLSLFFLVCYDKKVDFALSLIDAFPPWLIIAFEATLFLSSSAFFAYLLIRKRNLLSLTSFQDAYDAMPLGVCFYDEDGTLLLTNRFLLDFSDHYMDYYLMNAKEFIKRLEEGRWAGESIPFEGGRAYRRNDGKVFVLTFSDHLMNGKNVHELALSDVTELYELTEETKASNEELKASNERLRKIGREIASLRKEEENLLAKKKIHDDLGGLLLYAKSCLDKDLSEEEKEALLVYLEKQAKEAVSLEKKEIGEGLFEELKKAGEDIGVEVTFVGDKIPAGEEKFIYEAALECLLNAYRHGKAKRLEVNYIQKEAGHVLIISNDGSSSGGKVKEGSGLGSLHSLVRNRGGKMEIESSPKFSVTITMGKV